MADFEENQENGNEIEGEGEPEVDEKTEEEREEETELKQKEIDKLKEEIEKIKEDNAKTLERLEKLKAETPSKGTLREIFDFVSKTAASAFIFLTIATLYNKMQKKVGKLMSGTKISKEAEFFKEVSKINMLENKLFTVIAKWFDDHKDEDITLEEVSVKLVAMFETVLAKMTAALQKVHNDANTLSGKIKSNVDWKCMTVSDVTMVTSDSESVIESMKELKTLADKHLKKSRSLKTLLDILSKQALDDLDRQQNIINKILLE